MTYALCMDTSTPWRCLTYFAATFTISADLRAHRLAAGFKTHVAPSFHFLVAHIFSFLPSFPSSLLPFFPSSLLSLFFAGVEWVTDFLYKYEPLLSLHIVGRTIVFLKRHINKGCTILYHITVKSSIIIILL